MSTTEQSLVTVQTFTSEPDFLVARSRLEAAGIECFPKNLHTFGFYGGVLGVELQVRESDAEDALAILNDPGAGGNQPG